MMALTLEFLMKLAILFQKQREISSLTYQPLSMLRSPLLMLHLTARSSAFRLLPRELPLNLLSSENIKKIST
jgi:hypothetical protein